MEEDIRDVFDALRCYGCLLNFTFCLEGVLKVSSGGNQVHKKRNSSYSAMLTSLQGSLSYNPNFRAVCRAILLRCVCYLRKIAGVNKLSLEHSTAIAA